MKSQEERINRSFKLIRDLPIEIPKERVIQVIKTASIVSSGKLFIGSNLNTILLAGLTGIAGLIVFFQLSTKEPENLPQSYSGELPIDTVLVIDDPEKTLEEEDLRVKQKSTLTKETKPDSLENTPANSGHASKVSPQNLRVIDQTNKEKTPAETYTEAVPIELPKSFHEGKTVNMNTKSLRLLRKQLLKNEAINLAYSRSKPTLIEITDTLSISLNNKAINEPASAEILRIIDSFNIERYAGRKIILGSSYIIVGDFDRKFKSFYGFRGSVQGKMSEIEQTIEEISKSNN